MSDEFDERAAKLLPADSAPRSWSDYDVLRIKVAAALRDQAAELAEIDKLPGFENHGGGLGGRPMSELRAEVIRALQRNYATVLNWGDPETHLKRAQEAEFERDERRRRAEKPR